MTVLYFLVPLAVLLALGAVAAFRWAARDEQFDDLISPAVRILDDEIVAGRVMIDGGLGDAQNLRHSGGSK